MKNMKAMKYLGGAALLVSFAINSQASVITPGEFVFPPDHEAPLNGTIDATLSSSFLNGTQSGTLTSTVYSGYSGNPGGLTFVYQITETGSSDIATLGLNGFSPSFLLADVGIVPLSGVATPSAVSWSGDTMNFLFLAPELSGSSPSVLLVVNSAATVWYQNTANVIDHVTAGMNDLAPEAAVPEPTTMIAGALLLLPFGATTLQTLRKKRTV
jgi:hypothetical protein